MSKTLRIDIVTALDPKGVKGAEKLFATLTKAQVQAAQANAKVAQAQAQAGVAAQKLTTATANAAKAQTQAATAAQRLAQAQAQSAQAAARASTAQQQLAASTARAQQAQSQAALAALRYQQAQDRAVQSTDRAHRGLDRLASGLGRIEKGFGALGIAVGAQQLVSFGAQAIRMAADVDTAKRSLQALAGTPELYAEALGIAREQQRLFGDSLAENINGIQGLITVSRSSGIELQRLVDISQRLSIKDPAQGVRGARIALQEALSGDPRSLAMRYEIPKAALAKIRDESTSAAEALQIIDQYLNQIGITSEVASGSVSPLAVNLNELGAAAETAQTGIGQLIANAGILEKMTGFFQWVSDGIGAFNAIGDQIHTLGGNLLTTTSSFEEFSEKQQAAANELIKVGVVLPTLNEAAYKYAEGLMGTGVAADEAAARAMAMAEAFTHIQATTQILAEDTGLTTAEIDRIAGTMARTAEAGGPWEATMIALIVALRQGKIDSSQFLVAVDQLSTAQVRAANQTQVLGQATVQVSAGMHDASTAGAELQTVMTGIAQQGAAAKGGALEAGAGASIAGAQFAAATSQGLGLLSVMNQIAGRAAQAAGAQAQTSVVKGFGRNAGNAAQSQATMASIRGRMMANASPAHLAKLTGGGGGGGAAKISEAEKTAERLIEIEEETARRLMEIDARLAEQRLAAQKRLAETLLTTANDFAVNAEVNDLDFFGKDISDEQRQKLADRERAEAQAKERQKAAIDEAKRIAEEGDAELARATFEARQDQIQQLQELDETYYGKQREVGEDQQAALTQQYQEGVAAIEAQTGDKIALAQAEAQARIQAIEDEKAAVLTAAADQASALLSTGSAATTAKGQVEALSGALTALPTNITTTVTIRTVREGGETTGGGGASTKSAGGGTFVTTGPAHLTVGDNPGGIELVQVTPISGAGRTTVGSNMIKLAGGGSVAAGAADTARSRLDSGTTPTLPAGARAAKGGGASGAISAAASEMDALEAEQKALDLMLSILDLRERVLQAEGGTGRFGHDSDYANALRRLGDEAQFVALVVKNRALPFTEAEAEGLERYMDAAQGAIDTLSAVLALREQALAGDLDASKFGHDSDYANALRRLGDEAVFVAAIVQNRMFRYTEMQAELVERYVDVASGSIGLLQDVHSLRESLKEPHPPLDLPYVVALAEEAQRVTGIIRDRIVPFTEDGADALTRYADAAQASIAVLRDVAALREDVSGSRGLVLDPADVARLADDAQRLTQTVQGRLIPVTEEQADALDRYASAVGSSVSALRDTLGLTSDLFQGYTSPTDAQIGMVTRDAERIVKAVAAAAATYDTKGLEAARAYGDALGSVVGAYTDTLKFNEALLFSPGLTPDAGRLAQFEAGARAILSTTERLADDARRIPAGGLAALQTATSAITAQAEALIRMAAVPFPDLPRIAGAFGGANAGSVGGGVTFAQGAIVINGAGMNADQIANQVLDKVQNKIGTRR